MSGIRRIISNIYRLPFLICALNIIYQYGTGRRIRSLPIISIHYFSERLQVVIVLDLIGVIFCAVSLHRSVSRARGLRQQSRDQHQSQQEHQHQYSMQGFLFFPFHDRLPSYNMRSVFQVTSSFLNLLIIYYTIILKHNPCQFFRLLLRWDDDRAKTGVFPCKKSFCVWIRG